VDSTDSSPAGHDIRRLSIANPFDVSACRKRAEPYVRVGGTTFVLPTPRSNAPSENPLWCDVNVNWREHPTIGVYELGTAEAMLRVILCINTELLHGDKSA